MAVMTVISLSLMIMVVTSGAGQLPQGTGSCTHPGEAVERRPGGDCPPGAVDLGSVCCLMPCHICEPGTMRAQVNYTIHTHTHSHTHTRVDSANPVSRCQSSKCPPPISIHIVLINPPRKPHTHTLTYILLHTQ